MNDGMNDSSEVIEQSDENSNFKEKTPVTGRKLSRRRRKLRTLRRMYMAVVAVLLVMVIILGISLCVTNVKYNKLKDRHYSVREFDGPVTQAGELIPMYDSVWGEIGIPAAEGVRKCDYEIENIVEEDNGYRYYYEDGEVTSFVGIDVSTYNGDIDYEKVKESGVDFVMVRLGGRGYGESGILYADENYEQNLKNAKKAGLKVGAYFFSQAKNAKEAQEEARYAISLLKGYKLDYPLVYDWEALADTVARIDEVTPAEVTTCARAFCDEVIDEGFTPMLYAGVQMGYYKYDLSKLKDIDIWYAGYHDEPDFFYDYTIWQYTSSGSVPGIEGYVDINLGFKDYSE